MKLDVTVARVQDSRSKVLGLTLTHLAAQWIKWKVGGGGARGTIASGLGTCFCLWTPHRIQTP